MVREILRIKTDKGLGAGDPTFLDLEIYDYELSAPRMGMPQLTATLMYDRCLDDEWTKTEYTILRGEKYFLRQIPSSSKSNTDMRYKHEFVFYSERNVLSQVYFYDVVREYSSTADKPVSNSTNFSFYGTIYEFADRINCALRYAGIGDSILNSKTTLSESDNVNGDGYCVMVGDCADFDFEKICNLEFSDVFMWDALAEAFNSYEIPFEFVGKMIIFGRTHTPVAHVFKYGHNDALLSIQKSNANAKVVNRITFKGSSENIPYYYPNETEYGHVTLQASNGNKHLFISDVNIANMRQLLARAKQGEKIEYKKSSLDESTKAEGVHLSVMDSNGLYVPISTSGHWFSSVREECQVMIQFTISQPAHYYLKQLNGAFWFPNYAQPTELHNLIVGSGSFTRRTLEWGSQEGRELSLSEDGLIDLGELDSQTYRLILSSQIRSTVPGQMVAYVFDHTSIDISVKTEDLYYWESGDIRSPQIGGFGLASTKEIDKNCVGDSFYWVAEGQLTYQSNLMPPLYTRGAIQGQPAGAAPTEERFYNAINGLYSGPNGTYIFDNPWTPDNPNEYVLDLEHIKPTIEGVRNSKNQLFGEIADIAFDVDDNDVVSASGDSDGDATNYEHSFFYIKLHKFDGSYGFDLFNSAAQTGAMTIQMTSGSCNGCKFKVQALERTVDGLEVFENPVQTTSEGGHIADGNYQSKVSKTNIQKWQQNTQENEVWICLQKDVETFGVIMPNVSNDYRPAVGDTFNIIDIALPQEYIWAAEDRGEAEMLDYLSKNNSDKFTFNIAASRIFFAERQDLLATINEASIIPVEYNGKRYDLFVSNLTIRCKANEPLPEIVLDVTDTLAVGRSFMQQVAAQAVQMTGWAFPSDGKSGNIRDDGAGGIYLSKTRNDRSAGRISSDTALEVGNYSPGKSGGIVMIETDSGYSYIEVDKLHVRMKAIFEELEIMKTSSIAGQQIVTPGGSITVSFVEPLTQTTSEVDPDTGVETPTTSVIGYRCYFKAKDEDEGAECMFKPGDQVRCQQFNIGAGLHHNASNHFYWRLVTEVNNDKSYVVLSNTLTLTEFKGAGYASGSDAPQAGDVICHLGNRTDKSRQSAIVLSTVNAAAPCVTLYNGIDSFSLEKKEVVEYGVDKTTNPPTPYFHCYGNFFFGDKEKKKSYMEYDANTGVMLFKGKLSVESMIGDQTLSDYIKDNTGVGEDIKDYVDQVIGGFQDQIDGVIETWFSEGEPTLSNAPAVDWDTDELKQQHLGDLYYDNITGAAYRFSQDINGNYYWNTITDEAITKALKAAKNAQDTADGKRRVFTERPTPPYDEGDLWANASYSGVFDNDIARCVTSRLAGQSFNINDWVKASNYTDDTVANEARDRLNKWAEDGVFSPIEFNELRMELERIKGEYDGFEAQYDGYKDIANEVEGLNSTRDSYISAYTSYRNIIQSVLNATPDKFGCVPIPSTFAAKMNTYYAMRADYSSILALSARMFTLSQIAGLSYLQKALQEDTTIEGGLVMSSLISLGSGPMTNRETYAGMNGIYDQNLKGKTIATWWGGPMVDKEANPSAAKYATGLIRMDGTGYLANGAISWDINGNITADALSFFVGDTTIGNAAALFNYYVNEAINNRAEFAKITSIASKKPFNSILLSDKGGNRSVELTLTDDGTGIRVHGGLIADSYLVSGEMDSESDDEIAIATKLAELTDVLITAPSNGDVLTYDSSKLKWVNTKISTSGGASGSINATLWGNAFTGVEDITGNITIDGDENGSNPALFLHKSGTYNNAAFDTTMGLNIGSTGSYGIWVQNKGWLIGYNSSTQKIQYLSGVTHTFDSLIESTKSSGAPISVTSKTVCPNLNVDLLDGHHASDFFINDGQRDLRAMTIEAEDLYTNGFIECNGDLSVTGNATFEGSVEIYRVLSIYGADLWMSGGNIVNEDGSGNIGSATTPWDCVYAYTHHGVQFLSGLMNYSTGIAKTYAMQTKSDGFYITPYNVNAGIRITPQGVPQFKAGASGSWTNIGSGGTSGSGGGSSWIDSYLEPDPDSSSVILGLHSGIEFGLTDWPIYRIFSQEFWVGIQTGASFSTKISSDGSALIISNRGGLIVNGTKLA